MEIRPGDVQGDQKEKKTDKNDPATVPLWITEIRPNNLGDPLGAYSSRSSHVLIGCMKMKNPQPKADNR